jgi:hypothetical protein
MLHELRLPPLPPQRHPHELFHSSLHVALPTLGNHHHHLLLPLLLLRLLRLCHLSGRQFASALRGQPLLSH